MSTPVLLLVSFLIGFAFPIVWFLVPGGRGAADLGTAVLWGMGTGLLVAGLAWARRGMRRGARRVGQRLRDSHDDG